MVCSYLANSHSDWKGPQVAIKRHQHPWLHGRHEIEQYIMRLAQDYLRERDEKDELELVYVE